MHFVTDGKAVPSCEAFEHELEVEGSCVSESTLTCVDPWENALQRAFNPHEQPPPRSNKPYWDANAIILYLQNSHKLASIQSPIGSDYGGSQLDVNSPCTCNGKSKGRSLSDWEALRGQWFEQSKKEEAPKLLTSAKQHTGSPTKSQVKDRVAQMLGKQVLHDDYIQNFIYYTNLLGQWFIYNIIYFLLALSLCLSLWKLTF